jgi:hypothetical protein
LTPEPAQVTQCIEEMKLGERYFKTEENLLKISHGMNCRNHWINRLINPVRNLLLTGQDPIG